MDVYEVFHDDNARILDLAESLKHVPIDNPEGRKQLARETRLEVVSHNAAEERVLFPTLLDDPATHDAAITAHHENHAVETLLAELNHLPATDQRFTHKAQLLAERLQAHVRRLDDEIYPAAKKKRLGAENGKELLDQAMSEKSSARQRITRLGR